MCQVVTHLWPLIAQRLYRLLVVRRMIAPTVLRDSANLRHPIRYIDQNVIAFLYRISHLFNTIDTTLFVQHHWSFSQMCQVVTHLWPLIAQRLYRLLVVRRMIAPTVLRDSANLRHHIRHSLTPNRLVRAVRPFEFVNERTRERVTFQPISGPAQDDLPEEMNLICCKDITFCDT